MVVPQEIIIVALLLLLAGFTCCFRAYKKQLRSNTTIHLENKKLNALNETKNKLLAVLSHDLRPSLYRLRTINNQIKEAIPVQESEDISRLMQQNMMFVNNAYSLLDNMLHWVSEETKQSFFKQEKLHLRSITDQVCYHLSPFIAIKKITLIKNIDPQLFIYADINTIKIAIRNILENAIKYSPECEIIKIYAVTTKNQLQLVISDKGPGMDTETLQNIFNPHKKIRTKDSYGHISSGLGLHLVKSMIEKNGAVVSIKSKPAKGTKVCITFNK